MASPTWPHELLSVMTLKLCLSPHPSLAVH